MNISIKTPKYKLLSPKPTLFARIYYAGHQKGQYILKSHAGNDPIETKGQGQWCSTEFNIQTYRALSNKLKSSNPSKTNSSKLLVRLGTKTF